MPGMDISAIALNGLHQAETQVEQAAVRLGSIGSNPSQNTPVDTASLSEAAVSLIAGKDAYATGIKVLETANVMERQAIDLLA